MRHVDIQGVCVWGTRFHTLHLNYVVTYTCPLLFLFEQTHNYYVDNQGLVLWRLRGLGRSKGDSWTENVFLNQLFPSSQNTATTVMGTIDDHDEVCIHVHNLEHTDRLPGKSRPACAL